MNKAKAHNVVLTDVDVDEEKALAIPAETARLLLRTYAVLTYARSYYDLLVDRRAVTTVGQFLRDQEDELEDDESEMSPEELVTARAADGQDFDADTVFGEAWSAWMPVARIEAAAWLATHAPELFEQLAAEDTGWGMDYEPAPFVPADRRETLEAGLREPGYTVVRCAGLGAQFLNPDADLPDRIDTHEFPPSDSPSL